VNLNLPSFYFCFRSLLVLIFSDVLSITLGCNVDHSFYYFHKFYDICISQKAEMSYMILYALSAKEETKLI
jgi:hypothetical protein